MTHLPRGNVFVLPFQFSLSFSEKREWIGPIVRKPEHMLRDGMESAFRGILGHRLEKINNESSTIDECMNRKFFKLHFLTHIRAKWR
jgi:hypothetical protein